ncbi:MAG: hypothetical protein AB7T63_14865 [Planctomycetota bacterium]
MSQVDGDFRVHIGFFRHVKTRRLRAACGVEGVLGLLTVWAYAAENHADGCLGKLTPAEIELIADWSGSAGSLYTALVACGFADLSQAGVVTLHDWAEHQQWIVNRPARQRKARLASRARWGGDSEDEQAKPCSGHEADAPGMLGGSPNIPLSSPCLALPCPSKEDPPNPPRGRVAHASQQDQVPDEATTSRPKRRRRRRKSGWEGDLPWDSIVQAWNENAGGLPRIAIGAKPSEDREHLARRMWLVVQGHVEAEAGQPDDDYGLGLFGAAVKRCSRDGHYVQNNHGFDAFCRKCERWLDAPGIPDSFRPETYRPDVLPADHEHHSMWGGS